MTWSFFFEAPCARLCHNTVPRCNTLSPPTLYTFRVICPSPCVYFFFFWLSMVRAARMVGEQKFRRCRKREKKKNDLALWQWWARYIRTPETMLRYQCPNGKRALNKSHHTSHKPWHSRYFILFLLDDFED